MTIEELTTLEKLNEAFYECAKASYWKESTQRYKADLLSKNLKLQHDLRTGQYNQGKTIDFSINERGKKRCINAPNIRDRVVQKVLCKYVLVPRLSKFLIYDNYASLKGRGTSFARKRIEVLLRKFLTEHEDGYILQIDIRKYFDSIDHATIKQMVWEKLKEPPEVMNLVDYLIDGSSKTDIGLNLGAEIPQILSVFYLSGIDNYIKTVKGEKYYGRYMDDIFLISHDKEHLKDVLREIKAKLKDIKLEINDRKTKITQVKHGFTFMQIKYSVSDKKIIKRPTRSKITRERRRLKSFKRLLVKNRITLEEVKNCYKSWRNSLLTDCNSANKSILKMDKTFKELFNKPIQERSKTWER